MDTSFITMSGFLEELLPCTILEDREKLQRMVAEMWKELPERKIKKKK